MMKDRYDGAPGKDASMMKVRQKRYEAEHMSNNQFVKKVQAEQARHGGRIPNMPMEAMEFDAYMTNNGEHAQELVQKVTMGMDKVAFPVKPTNTSERD
jgi:hypothetical protein